MPRSTNSRYEHSPNTDMSALLNGKQFQTLFPIKPNSYNVAKNKNSHDFLRLNTGFTDDFSWQRAALGQFQTLGVLCYAALRGRQMGRFEKN